MPTATLPPNRTAFRQAVAEIAAKAQVKLPECGGRLDTAVKMVLAGDVTLLPDGTAEVYSQSNGVTTYAVVNGHCDCRDFAQAPHGLCKHRLSAAIARRALALAPPPSEAMPVPPPAPGALPEAPVSITLRATLHGHEVLVTLRGHDFASVQAQVEQASAWLRSQAPAAPPEEAHSQEWCAIHNIQMRLNRGKDGKPDWFSHKTTEGQWCKGKRGRS